ncbi:hypothetical protein LTR22_026215 [Elasticomyces elasticus]|nr:hypothetical protein LTR22_026215 [Elasticomyces elasticus]
MATGIGLRTRGAATKARNEASANSARHAVLAVFNTAELLEAISLQLDATTTEGLKTLLLSQRVNKPFNETINRSPHLQRMLYFRSVDTTIPSVADRPQDPAIPNPLLFIRYSMPERFIGRSSSPSCSDVSIFTDYHSSPMKWVLSIGIQSDWAFKLDQVLPAGSWRRMYPRGQRVHTLVQFEDLNYLLTEHRKIDESETMEEPLGKHIK